MLTLLLITKLMQNDSMFAAEINGISSAGFAHPRPRTHQVNAQGMRGPLALWDSVTMVLGQLKPPSSWGRCRLQGWTEQQAQGHGLSTLPLLELKSRGAFLPKLFLSPSSKHLPLGKNTCLLCPNCVPAP